MDEFSELIRNQRQYKQIREDKYKHDSKDRLSKILKRKVETTMIGAIASIEEHFGFLWDTKKSDMTSEKKVMHDIFQKVRSEILDKGNTQARNVDAELNQYEVKWMRYTMNIPVKQRNGGMENE